MHYEDPCPLPRRTSKTLGKTKETKVSFADLRIPLWDVREGIKGDRIPATVSQKLFKNLVETSIPMKKVVPRGILEDSLQNLL